MIQPSDLHNRATLPAALTDRQQQVLVLVRQYQAVACELPSTGWLSRRLNISRQRALDHIGALRRKGWL